MVELSGLENSSEVGHSPLDFTLNNAEGNFSPRLEENQSCTVIRFICIIKPKRGSSLRFPPHSRPRFSLQPGSPSVVYYTTHIDTRRITCRTDHSHTSEVRTIYTRSLAYGQHHSLWYCTNDHADDYEDILQTFMQWSSILAMSKRLARMECSASFHYIAN
jgi:hypothetical protein